MTGNELSRNLSQHGNKVIGFDNFFCSSLETVKDLLDSSAPTPPPHGHKLTHLFEFHEWDINNDEHMSVLKSIVNAQKPDYDRIVYINCAAVVHTEYFYHVNATFDTNVLGMRRFLEQAIMAGADVFINCSTSEVYSMQSFREGGVRESDYVLMSDAEHSQRTSYATGKLLTEFFMKDAVDSGRIKGCSIRFANVYSKNELYPKHIIPYIINQLRTTGKVELLENSRKNRRTFLHNEDSCSAVIELINTESALDGSVYNVATDEEITIVDLVRLCAKKLGIDDPQINFKGYRENDPERRLLNTEKIRTKTSWRPHITLDKGIEMLLEEKRK